MTKSGRSTSQKPDKRRVKTDRASAAAFVAAKQELEDGIAAVSAPTVESHSFCENPFSFLGFFGLCPDEPEKNSFEGSTDLKFVDVLDIPEIRRCSSCVSLTLTTVTITPSTTITATEMTEEVTVAATQTITSAVTASDRTVTRTVPVTKNVTTTLTNPVTERKTFYETETWIRTIHATTTTWHTETPAPTQRGLCEGVCHHVWGHAQALAELPRKMVDNDRDPQVRSWEIPMAFAIMAIICWLVVIPVAKNMFSIFDRIADLCWGKGSDDGHGKYGGIGRRPRGGGGGGDGDGDGSDNDDEGSRYEPDSDSGSQRGDDSESERPEHMQESDNDEPEEHSTKDQPEEEEEVIGKLPGYNDLGKLSGKSTPNRSSSPSAESDSDTGGNGGTRAPELSGGGFEESIEKLPDWARRGFSPPPEKTSSPPSPRTDPSPPPGEPPAPPKGPSGPPPDIPPQPSIPQQTTRKSTESPDKLKNHVVKGYDWESVVQQKRLFDGGSDDDTLSPLKDASSKPKSEEKEGQRTSDNPVKATDKPGGATSGNAGGTGPAPGGTSKNPPNNGGETQPSVNVVDSNEPTKIIPAPGLKDTSNSRPSPNVPSTPAGPASGNQQPFSTTPNYTPPGKSIATDKQIPAPSARNPTVARKQAEAEAAFHRIYPGRPSLQNTSGLDLLCGLHAVVISLEGLHSRGSIDRSMVPTTKNLLMETEDDVYQNIIGEFNSREWTRNKNFFSADQLINIIGLWMRNRHRRQVILGVVVEGPTGTSFQRIAFEPEREKDLDNIFGPAKGEAIEFFIHHMGRNYDDAAAHYSGIHPELGS